MLNAPGGDVAILQGNVVADIAADLASRRPGLPLIQPCERNDACEDDKTCDQREHRGWMMKVFSVRGSSSVRWNPGRASIVLCESADPLWRLVGPFHGNTKGCGFALDPLPCFIRRSAATGGRCAPRCRQEGHECCHVLAAGAWLDPRKKLVCWHAHFPVVLCSNLDVFGIGP